MTSENRYFLKIDWNYVDKELKKYPRNIITKIKRDITMLEINPYNGDYLDKYKATTLYKKRFQEVEIYYSVENIFIVVLAVNYIGTVDFYGIESGIKSGKYSKHTTSKQQRMIKQYKDKFYKHL